MSLFHHKEKESEPTEEVPSGGNSEVVERDTSSEINEDQLQKTGSKALETAGSDIFALPNQSEDQESRIFDSADEEEGLNAQPTQNEAVDTDSIKNVDTEKIDDSDYVEATDNYIDTGKIDTNELEGDTFPEITDEETAPVSDNVAESVDGDSTETTDTAEEMPDPIDFQQPKKQHAGLFHLFGKRHEEEPAQSAAVSEDGEEPTPDAAEPSILEGEEESVSDDAAESAVLEDEKDLATAQEAEEAEPETAVAELEVEDAEPEAKATELEAEDLTSEAEAKEPELATVAPLAEDEPAINLGFDDQKTALADKETAEPNVAIALEEPVTALKPEESPVTVTPEELRAAADEETEEMAVVDQEPETPTETAPTEDLASETQAPIFETEAIAPEVESESVLRVQKELAKKTVDDMILELRRLISLDINPEAEKGVRGRKAKQRKKLIQEYSTRVNDAIKDFESNYGPYGGSKLGEQDSQSPEPSPEQKAA
ncbi:MAG: hypothetical protein LBQ02_02760 [Candidatus Nomurabacteria bacterium]|jgi:hypothetical protein|nr:hypothetical protein [Candidatus Nomurabacteria bacterium]